MNTKRTEASTAETLVDIIKQAVASAQVILFGSQTNRALLAIARTGQQEHVPRDPSIWGLRNLGQEKWGITTPDGAIKDVPPGRSATLNVGAKINFDKREGESRL